jgi:hypothetical protein
MRMEDAIMSTRPLFEAVVTSDQIEVFPDRLEISGPSGSWTCRFPQAVIVAGQRIAWIDITTEMMEESSRLVAATQMSRTRAHDHDALLGHIGELAWSVYRYGTIHNHHIAHNFGTADDGEFEIKISAVDLAQSHHLKVREDYLRRPASYYVQMFIEGGQAGVMPTVGQRVIIAGYLPGNELHQLGHWTTEGSGENAFRTLSVPVRYLRSLTELEPNLKGGTP